MTVTKQDIEFALAHLAETFPQTFVLEKYRPHRPLKVGIAADIRERCPGIERRVLGVRHACGGCRGPLSCGAYSSRGLKLLAKFGQSA